MRFSRNDYNEIICHMNNAFNKDEEHLFERLVPKLYFIDNEKMEHFGVKVNGKIVSSVGLYEETLISKYGSIKLGLVGGVSTNALYRCQNFMQESFKEMLDFAKDNDYDLLLLTGDRVRYNHFGFDDAGRALLLTFTQRGLYKLNNTKEYEIIKVNENDNDYLKKMEEFYYKQELYVKRDHFYKSLLSWTATPYIVKSDGKIIGYFTIKENRLVNEVFYEFDYEDTMFKAILDNKDIVTIRLPYSYYSEKLINKASYYEIVNDAKYRILKKENVIKFLGGNDCDLSFYEILGNQVESSKLPLTIYTSCNDQG